MENRAHALAAGIFTILLGCAAVLALWWFSGKREDVNYYLLETRGNVSGLNAQAQVRYRGIRAGRVEDIEVDAADPRLILVRISLASKYPLSRAATARLAYQGVTGLAFVLIEDDGSQAELLEGTDEKPARIAMRPSFFDSLGDKAGDLVTRVDEVAKRLAAVLDEKNTRHLARTMENLAEASDGLRQLPQIVAGLRQALSAENLARLSALLAHLEKTAGEAAPLTTELREMVRTLAGLSRRVDGLAAEADVQTLPRANALLRELSVSSRQLSRLLDTLEQSPDALLFGKAPAPPGPGETGFAAPRGREGE